MHNYYLISISVLALLLSGEAKSSRDEISVLSASTNTNTNSENAKNSLLSAAGFLSANRANSSESITSTGNESISDGEWILFEIWATRTRNSLIRILKLS